MRRLACVVVSLGLACSATSLDDSSTTPAVPPPAPTQGLDAPDAQAGIAPCERNFYTDEVVCYPTDDVGTRFRTSPDGGTPSVGSRIPNIKFTGYEQIDPSKVVDTSNGPQTLPLSEYYDPESRRLKLLQIVGSTGWCDPCNQQTEDLAGGVASMLAMQGVQTLQVLEQGLVASGDFYSARATLMDLADWIKNKKPDFSEVINADAFLPFHVVAEIPFTVFVDARSMEILGEETGYDPQFAAVKRWIQWVDTNPPRP